MAHATHPPPLFSSARITSFLTCLLVALASGTNYVFSAYGPQLGARLSLSHTQINMVGLSGNIGVYGTAPIWGGIVDRKGPRIMMVIAFFSLLVGYLGIRHFYDGGLAEGEGISILSFCSLVFFAFLTGIGGNGGLVGALNTTAKSWPDRARATANGVVISGFGLSAFLFSTIAHTLFPGNTSDFLLVLAIGTALPMILGFFFVRPIPAPHLDPGARLEHGALVDSTEYGVVEGIVAGTPTAFTAANSSSTHLLARDEDEDEEDGSVSPRLHEHAIELEEEDEEEEEARLVAAHGQVASEYVVPAMADSLMLSPTRDGFARQRTRSSSRRSGRSHLDKAHDGGPNIHGKRMFMMADFWLLFLICSLLSGTGLMYINNVGAISQALFANGNPDYDEVAAAQWQATQVSTVSITNCLGRIVLGVVADFTKARLGLPRSCCIALVAALFIISQLTVFHTESISELWKASALLGLAYGGLFGLFPTLVIEWFGLPHFSENWGYVSLSPMLGGNVFSLAFGRNLDAHSDTSDSADTPAASITTTALSALSSLASAATNTTTADGTLSARGGIPSSHHCAAGRACYVDSLRMTIAACCVALALGAYAAWRDVRRQTRAAAVHPPPVVVWDAEE